MLRSDRRWLDDHQQTCSCDMRPEFLRQFCFSGMFCSVTLDDRWESRSESSGTSHDADASQIRFPASSFSHLPDARNTKDYGVANGLEHEIIDLAKRCFVMLK